MHEVSGCPRRACLFHLSDISENDRNLPLPYGALAKAKTFAE